MPNKKLRQILERSKMLLPTSENTGIPEIQRTWSQLERDIKQMSERIQPTQELHAKAHYFLASNGIDTEHMTTPMDTSQTFTLVEVENNTDLERFLGEEHEKRLINIIESKRAQNVDDFETFYSNQFEEIHQSIKKERQQEIENAVDYKEYEKNSNATLVVRINDYANVVANLNNERLKNSDFDLIQNLANIRNMSELRKAQDCAFETWNIIKYLVDKSDITGRSEGRFTKTYASQSYQEFSAIKTRRALISTAKSWLENQASVAINETLNRHAQTIKIGGNPSFSHRLNAFINLTFKAASGWSDKRLEIVDDSPIWVFMFYLIRCGRLELAAQFVDTNREKFAEDRKFVLYFEEYVNAEYHCVSKATQEAILADYHTLEYGEQAVDPFKVILYKILGRCELHKKTLFEVIHTTEDYIWLQLTLVREVTDEESYSFNRYRLCDLQNHVSTYSSNYFDPENTNPWVYFRILILTLQFEKAIDFLYKQKNYRLETVHFAAALVYHGLLRIIPANQTDTKLMFITENAKNQVHYFNFPRLLYQYVQVFLSESRQNALQYLYLLSLYSPTNGYHDQSMIQLAKLTVCQFILDTKDFETLLGTTNDTLKPGLIQSQKSLLYIDSKDKYTEEIMYPTAEKCIQMGRCLDAVNIYVLAHDYNNMVDALARGLNDALKQSQDDRIMDCTLSDESNTTIVEFATRTMQDYDRFEAFTEVISPQRQSTIRILIQLLKFRTAYEQNEYQRALQQLEQANIVPLAHDHRFNRNLVQQFDSLDEQIKSNVPEILLNVMDILYKTWAHQNVRPTALKQFASSDLENRARAILIFAGSIQYNITNDIMARLNRAYVLMMKSSV
ncbi:Nup93/Nic96-domain-containing protein [Parasitella parasitica]|nr:Nup93/Nic96-domain-containing protein [Parasitella parasitica]